MKTLKKIAISVVAAVGLSVTISSVSAQQGPMGGMGPGANGMSPGMMRGGMQCQMMDHSANMKVMRELMTPAERLAMMDKMIDAKTPQERHEIMTSTHAEMEKRAKEKGITLPVGCGHQMMSGRSCG